MFSQNLSSIENVWIFPIISLILFFLIFSGVIIWVFKKDKSVVWRCMNCGFIFEAAEAPELCPACAHPRAHFEVLAENW